VVADVRIGESDELAGEARGGHRLLVAAHPGREDDLAGRGLVGAARLAVETRAVLERHGGGHDRTTAHERPPQGTEPAASVSSTRPRMCAPAKQQFSERLS